jgi:hypothetical protein
VAIIEYTAKRSLATGHAANVSYSIELDLVEATSEVVDVCEKPRSPGGGVEPSFERQDTFWNFQFAPVSGFDLELLREFLDSIESGELFRVWIWPDDTAPLTLKRSDDSGHSEDAFMRCGAEDRDYFTAQFRALQVAAYDVTGSGAPIGGGGASGGGSGGGGGETTDIYDPDIGGPTGGLGDEEPGVFTFMVEDFDFFYVGYKASPPVGSIVSNDSPYTILHVYHHVSYSDVFIASSGLRTAMDINPALKLRIVGPGLDLTLYSADMDPGSPPGELNFLGAGDFTDGETYDLWTEL